MNQIKKIKMSLCCFRQTAIAVCGVAIATTILCISSVHAKCGPLFGLTPTGGGGMGATGYFVGADGTASRPLDDGSGFTVEQTSAYYAATAQAFDPATHRAYFIQLSGSTPYLVAFNTKTGAQIALSEGNARLQIPTAFHTMVFDPVTKKLFGLAAPRGFGIDAYGFRIICDEIGMLDPETGVYTKLADDGSTYIATAFAFDSYAHKFYAQRIEASGITLVSIDTRTGAMKEEIPFGNIPFRTMSFDPNTGDLVGLMGYGTAAQMGNGFIVGGTGFYRYDPNITREASLITNDTSLYIAMTTVLDPSTGKLYLQCVDNPTQLVSLNIITGAKENIAAITDPLCLAVMDNPPPSLLTLAKMAESTYTYGSSAQPPQPIDGYSYVFVNGAGNGGQGFYAIVYRNESQVVVAFRGTETGNSYSMIKNLFFADSVFTSPNPSEAQLSMFLTYVSNGVDLITNVYNEFSTSNITLTGHSLGGGLSQVFSSYTDLPSISFNAPGIGHLISNNNVVTVLSRLNNLYFYNNGPNINIRMYGDQISFAGTPIDSEIETLTIDTNDELKPHAGEFVSILPSHAISLMIEQITKSANITAGFLGPKASIKVWFGESLANKGRAFIQTVEQTDPRAYGIDPEISKEYLFKGDSESPLFSSIKLPLMEGVYSYNISYLNGDTWKDGINILPMQKYIFDTPSNSIKFMPLNENGKNIAMPSDFIFEISFTKTGLFKGTLTYKKNLCLAPIYLLLEK